MSFYYFFYYFMTRRKIYYCYGGGKTGCSLRCVLWISRFTSRSANETQIVACWSSSTSRNRIVDYESFEMRSFFFFPNEIIEHLTVEAKATSTWLIVSLNYHKLGIAVDSSGLRVVWDSILPSQRWFTVSFTYWHTCKFCGMRITQLCKSLANR